MDTFDTTKIKNKLIAGWNNLVKKSDEDDIAEVGRERIVVFIVALILALCLWLMVNLSRDYNLNIDLPIQLGAIPADKALVEDLPETATVSVTGEGWKLINLYNNPPNLNINVDNSEVNLYDQVQQQMNALPDIDVQKVQPTVLRMELEDQISKKVPVRSLVDVSFRKQYNFVESPQIQPDSVTISGAESLLSDIQEWSTESVRFENIAEDLNRRIPLENPSNLLTISEQEVTYRADVTQYTEGEVQVNIYTRNLPNGRMVTYSPSYITVRYDVPIDEYAQVQDIRPFEAFVTYRQVQQDSTGFVTPQIEQSANDYHIKLRSFQPRRVAYFMVLGN
jgi:YbbR domain-containing protein